MEYPKRRADVRVRVVDGDLVVFDRHQALIHHLNPTARYIWEQCDGTVTVADISHRLAEAFGVAPQTAAADVAIFLAHLYTIELLESQDRSARPADFDL
jgi:hypothetical protein